MRYQRLLAVLLIPNWVALWLLHQYAINYNTVPHMLLWLIATSWVISVSAVQDHLNAIILRFSLIFQLILCKSRNVYLETDCLYHHHSTILLLNKKNSALPYLFQGLPVPRDEGNESFLLENSFSRIKNIQVCFCSANFIRFVLLSHNVCQFS